MMDDAVRTLLRTELVRVGAAPSEEQLSRILRHLELVALWNERVNLTAITEPSEMVVKHAIDSASLLAVAKVSCGTRVIDVGTGAGFPGVILKCLHPDVRLVLLESLGKRCKFLEEACTELFGSPGTSQGWEVVWGRAEEFGQKAGYREAFDLVTARAVADMRVLSEYCLPYARVGGQFVAMKGPNAGGEVSGAEPAIAVLGGDVGEVKRIELPLEAGARTLVVVEKRRATPNAYPRKPGTPAKTPL